jgi:tetratricopeptide (TPR) repeat protein
MSVVAVDQLLAEYRAALDELPPRANGLADAAVLRVLATRDALMRALGTREPTDGAVVGQLSALDQLLKASAPDVDAAVGRSTLAEWRESVQPARGAWWWSLDEIAAAAEPRPSPLWMLFTGFLCTAALSIIADTANKFLAEGPDIVGVFSILFQGLLVLVAGSAFIDASRQGIDRLLLGLRVQSGRLHRWYFALALLTLLVAIVVRLLLPTIAALYNAAANRAWDVGNAEGAVESYRRAIALAPGSAQAHNDLGNALDVLGRFDEARGAYQAALKADPLRYPVYVALARLQILHLDLPADALALVDRALATGPQDAGDRYGLFVSRAWANHELGLPGQALRDLQRAIEARSDGAAAICLLPQVLEANGNSQAAQGVWPQCLEAAGRGQERVEASWVSLAAERAGR